MVEAPEPEIKRADEVKIRVAYCGVCGSDLHFKRAELDFLFEGDEGTPIGHEATGVITELGPAATCKGLKVGDRVGGGAQYIITGHWALRGMVRYVVLDSEYIDDMLEFSLGMRYTF